MDFDFSDDQQQLRDAVRRWVDKGYTFERRRAIVAAGGFDRAAYGELAELGLTALTVPEAHGGLGQGTVDAIVAMEELGRGIVLEPLAHTFIAASVLGQYAPEAVQAGWLPRIATGEALVVLAHQERKARYRLDVCEAKAAPTSTGHAVTALKSIVPAGDQADAYLVPAHLDGRIALFLVERAASGVAARGYLTQDGSRAAEVVLDNAAATLVTTDGLAALVLAVDTGIA
jgi:alkylation response protein AidB-like acyl-CoA dehydrogenase